jgi:hypothetical protein
MLEISAKGSHHTTSCGAARHTSRRPFEDPFRIVRMPAIAASRRTTSEISHVLGADVRPCLIHLTTND